MDARDFNTSFISTEHLKQKYFLNVVQLLSFNLMLLIFLKLTILLFLIAFFGCRCGVVICQQWICVCFCVCCKNIYLHLFKTQNSCAITFYVFHLFWAQSSEQIYSWSHIQVSTSHGALCCAGLVFVFRVWSRIVQLVLVPHRSQRKAQKPSHVEFL